MVQSDSSLEQELLRFRFSFPILDKLSAYLLERGGFAGRKIGWHCHLTALTATSADVLLKAGAELFMSECSRATTDQSAVKYMKQQGAHVYLGESSCARVLEHRPEIISDTGFVLNRQYRNSVSAESGYIIAACEITTSGVQELRRDGSLDYPLININDCELKTLIENFHGVGDGVVDALFRLTGRLWSGRPAAVLGYGRVGAGVAYHLRRTGAAVYVIESDPTRKLLAHYDGFALIDLDKALADCQLLVTASGAKKVISEKQFAKAKDGIILMNVGHWADEIDLDALKAIAICSRQSAAFLDEFELSCPGGLGKKLYLVAEGAPANVAMLSGSCEPTLIHLSTEILCMNYLLSLDRNELAAKLSAGENPVPPEVQTQISLLALECLELNA